MDERNIWRSAKLILDQHGDATGTHAAMRADALLDDGNLEGART